MNTIGIITAIVALLGGLAVGTTLSTTDAPDVEQITNQTRNRLMSENPPAQDFVSMRPGISDLPNEALSEAETEGLLLMREEEKLARDVYQILYEKWSLQIFANIAQSEQTHTEAVRDLLEKYNITDPVTDDTIGVFKSETMQKLYTDLVAQGEESETAALTVGATIEDLDIKDLQDLIAETDNQDIKLVYENLMRGSRNHLRAFTRQLTMRGETYAPQYISATDYATIISSSQETGMGGAGMQNSGGMGQHGGNRGWGGGGRNR
jgi:hypothetical protein